MNLMKRKKEALFMSHDNKLSLDKIKIGRDDSGK